MALGKADAWFLMIIWWSFPVYGAVTGAPLMQGVEIASGLVGFAVIFSITWDVLKFLAKSGWNKFAENGEPTVYLVKFDGLFECEAFSAEEAEAEFEMACDDVMARGCVSYHKPLTEAEYEEREQRC